MKEFVEIKTKNNFFRGIVLESYDPDSIILKLENGYNIGIRKKDILEIKKLKKIQETRKKIKIKQNKNLSGVSFIITGGTISSRIDYETGAVKPLTKASELLSLFPKISEIVKINKIEIPFTILSENITAKHWQILAKKTAELLNKKENQGVIITHGTDTLHYTSAALSFMLENLNKPVILTYSQRSTDRGSSDAFLNLICSAHVAISDIAEVMVVGHASLQDNFCFALRGTKTRKMHTSRRDTFRPINSLPIAKIFPDGKIKKMSEFRKRDENKKVKTNIKFEEKIALIKFFPNSDPKILDFFINKNYKGLVIEATGFGHVAIENKSWKEKIKKAIDSGIIVCFAPQTIYGSLNSHVYSTARILENLGVLFLKDMHPETAYIKLGCVLGRTKNQQEIKELMLKNLANEFNEKLGEEDFLC